jgi:putative transposase
VVVHHDHNSQSTEKPTMDMFALCQCRHPDSTTTALRPRHRMALARLGISRWAGKGGRDRTVQRLFSQALPGAMLWWGGFRQPGSRPGAGSLLAGDAVVVTTAGKPTDGLERFWASRSRQVGPGLACCARSWVSVQARRSFPLRVEQLVRSAAETAASRAKAAAQPPPPSTTRRRPGRPQGRQTQAPAAATLTPALVRISSRLESLLPLLTPSLPLTSLRLEGPFGHPNAWPMAHQCRVHLLSKGRADAA